MSSDLEESPLVDDGLPQFESSSVSSSIAYYRSSILKLFLAPGLGGFLFGYDIGGTSYVILRLQQLSQGLPLSLQDNPLKTGWFVAAPSAGALLGTAAIVYLDNPSKDSSTTTSNPQSFFEQNLLSQPIGRRTELFCAGLLYLCGGFLQFESPLLFQNWAFAFVIVGRWIYGAGIGFAMHGGPTYLAETTPPSIRGMVVGAKEIAIVLGILSGYAMGDKLCQNNSSSINGEDASDENHQWTYVYGATCIIALAMIAGSRIIPESPRYLVATNTRLLLGDTVNDDTTQEQRDELSAQVLESLRFVWKPLAAQEEHTNLLEAQKNQTQEASASSSSDSSKPSLRSLLWDPKFRPALTAGLGLVLLQQITGQPSVLSYATPILAKVPGMSSSASVLLAIFKVLATSISVGLVEGYGRKTLLLVGCSMMLGALVVLVFAFQENSTTSQQEEEDHHEASATAGTLDAKSLGALIGLFSYIAGYQIGFGPISWLMISEVFPQSVRGTAVALAVQLNFAGNAIVQLAVPILEQQLGMSKTFLLFGGLTAYSLHFVQQHVPETKGLSLEEIEAVLAKRVEDEERVQLL